MQSPFVRLILRYSTVFARLAVAAVFLSNVADRLGLWGPPGTGSVAWGNLENFYDSVRLLNPYLPELLVPVVGWIVSGAEVVLAILLIVGFKTRLAGLLSGLLLLTFAVANAIAFNIKVPLNYSIFSASAAALLIAAQDYFPLSIDSSGVKKSIAIGATAVAALFVLVGCRPEASPGQPTCDLVGAWEPISLQFTRPDGTVDVVEIGDPPGLKVLSETRWVFVEVGSGEQGPTSGGGGTYTVDGNSHTEFVEYHGATSFVGEAIEFECRTENDRWYQSGELPNGSYLEEVYRRLD